MAELNGHLEKAKAALDAAKGLDTTDPKYIELLTVARVQADVASAAALESIATHLDYLFPRS